MNNLFRKIISISKTLYFNLKIFNIHDALKIPVLISYDTKIGKISKGNICILSKIEPMMIKIGFGGSEGIVSRGGYISLGINSKLLFHGKASLAEGTSIRCDSGTLEFGDNFSANKNCFFSCNNLITLGKDVLVGYDVSIRDSDGHNIYQDGKLKLENKPIAVGNHVWIASNVNILKGVIIGENSVVAYGSTVIGQFEEPDCLIGGSPAKVKSKNISWKI